MNSTGSTIGDGGAKEGEGEGNGSNVLGILVDMSSASSMVREY